MLPALRRATISALAFALISAQAPCARADVTEQCIADADTAQRARIAGHLADATKAAISCARAACPPAIASDCKTWLAEIENVRPTIVFRATVDGADAADVKVSLDDTVIARSLDGREVDVDPGSHVLRFEHAGFSPVVQRVLVVEGKRARVIEAAFVSPKSEPKPAARSDEEWHVPVVTWILGGVGIAAAGTGVGFWIAGSSEKNSLASECGVTRACSADDESSAKTKLVVGDVLVIAGAAAVAGAVVIAIGSRASFRASVDGTSASVGVRAAF